MASVRGKRGKGATRITVETPESEAETEPETASEAAEVEAEQQTETVLASVPLQTVVRLWRRDRQGREAYLDAIDAALLGGGDVSAGLPAYVKQHYGGGEYRFDIRGPIGKGRAKGYKGGGSFTVDKAIPPKYPHDPEPEEPARAAALAPSGSSLGDSLNTAVVTLVLDLVRQGQDAQRQMMESNRVQNELMLSQIRQMQENNRPRDDRDPLEMFQRMAEIMRPAQQAGSPLGQLKELLEVRDLLTGEKAEPSALGIVAEIAPQLLGTINKALDGRQPAQPQPAATIHNPDGKPVAEVPGPIPPAQPAPAPEGAAVLQLLGRWVPRLAQWAEQDRNPEWVAETLLYEVPAGYHAALQAAIEPEEAVGQIVAGFPIIAPFGDWLAEVRTALLASLHADDDDDAQRDSGGG